ncbi:Predicted dehydrogenase [Cognatiyoonia koreensis]|uniref:Predicted dehydrogenase n=1 Tax=Cognatiyoonia koreensis TaxID=364200 RepID=A0A1I0MRU2_9RHOB|nr:Gfo/Idh/MocA family oxidoreductase [Cognatiyoonia koreensis]SEV91047.1 Predicted dehydrogenase [Cognatiyoonia koreensis]
MIRVGCLGAGYFSQFHIDAWQRIDGATLVGVADTDLTKAQATPAPAFGALDDMLSHATPELLDIIIPPAGHARAIRTAIKAGIKTIICQKPFCTSLAEAEDIVALADEKDITLIVHENFRFQPWYRTIKAAIDNGDIGTPLQATFRLRPGDGQGPDAYLARQPYFQKMDRFLIHETGVHWVDTFRYLFGDPTAVYADLRRVNPVIAGEDAAVLLFDHPNGVRTIFDANRCLDHAAENTRCTMGEGLFEGDKGTLSLFGDGSVHLRAFGSQDSQVLLAPDKSGTFGGDCTYHLQSHVIAALQGLAPFENTAAAYLIVIKTEQAIYSSAEHQKKVVVSSQ